MDKELREAQEIVKKYEDEIRTELAIRKLLEIVKMGEENKGGKCCE